MFKLLQILFLLFLFSCAGISTLNRVDRSKLYGDGFLLKVNEISAFIDNKMLAEAERHLKMMDENDMSENEVSLKRYLLGRLYLGRNDSEKAIFNFELTLSGIGDDSMLISQARLGLAIGYYRLGIYDRSLENLKKVDEEGLSPREKLNIYNIGYQISKAFQNQSLYERSLIGLVSMLSKIDFKESENYKELFSLLSAKSLEDQLLIARELSSSDSEALIHISLRLAEGFIYSGLSQEALEILEKLQEKEISEDLNNIIFQLKTRLVDDKKVSSKKIGVILPLSGKYKKYGVHALNGIQLAFDNLLKNDGYQIKVRDSKSSPVVSAFYAKELFEKEKVGMIIGGLSSGEAKYIYLETKNKKVPFVSLAQVFLPRVKKDKFLLELPPSIESEINEISHYDNINKLGNRGAIIFPQDEAGEYYFKEFFRSSKGKFQLVDAVTFSPKENDFREPVRHLLNLKYKSLREEEYNLMRDFYDSEETVSVRRVQTLSPETNFDWVFIPVRPLEAIQLIPSFNYYDAFNTLMIGPATWNNTKIRKLGRKNRKLHFLDERRQGTNSILETEFISKYKVKPNVISSRAIKALGIASKLLPKSGVAESREDFLTTLYNSNVLEFGGETWTLKEGIWIKNLGLNFLSRGKPREGIKN